MELGPIGLIAVSAEGPMWPGRSAMGLAKLNEARRVSDWSNQQKTWGNGFLGFPTFDRFFGLTLKNHQVYTGVLSVAARRYFIFGRLHFAIHCVC